MDKFEARTFLITGYRRRH